MRHARTLIAGLAVLGVLNGCSPAYRAAQHDCRQKADSAVPANYQQITVNKVRYEKVPDGNVQCVQNFLAFPYDGTGLSCTQGTKRIQIPYTQVETVDVNKEQRDRLYSQCVARRCPKGLFDKNCGGSVSSDYEEAGFEKIEKALRKAGNCYRGPNVFPTHDAPESCEATGGLSKLHRQAVFCFWQKLSVDKCKWYYKFYGQ
jgi:hypothetical protein